MTRHAPLADQLKALLIKRNEPEGPIETVKTNWRTGGAVNDNNPEDLEGLHIERRGALRPSVAEIMREVEQGEVERAPNALTKDDKTILGPIVRIGKLRFSDGAQTERAHRYSVDGKVVEYDAVMPVGAMLGTKDRQERVLGGDTVVSNSAYTTVYGAKYPNAVTRKGRADRKEISKAEMREQLDAAVANTPVVPKVIKCPAGFPWKPSNLRELFTGLEKGRKGESGSIAWEDVSTHIVEREVWTETLASLSRGDMSTLDAAMTASSMKDLSGGKGGGSAYKVGRARLATANDNFIAAMRKSAA